MEWDRCLHSSDFGYGYEGFKNVKIIDMSAEYIIYTSWIKGSLKSLS